MEQTSIGDRWQRLARWRWVGRNGGVRRAPGVPIARRAAWLALATTFWAACALADEIPGARPSDEALSCEQIYAQGIMTKMTVRHLQGEPMEKTLAWAEAEVEGFLR